MLFDCMVHQRALDLLRSGGGTLDADQARASAFLATIGDTKRTAPVLARALSFLRWRLFFPRGLAHERSPLEIACAPGCNAHLRSGGSRGAPRASGSAPPPHRPSEKKRGALLQSDDYDRSWGREGGIGLCGETSYNFLKRSPPPSARPSKIALFCVRPV